MPRTADPSANEPTMNCLEVRGGSCASNHGWQRPGLDLWIQSPALEFAEAGGGDLHFLSSCASGRITRMLLADVCGMGSLFSELAGTLRDLVKSHVNSIQQARLVADISSRLRLASHQGGFASLMISTYFAPTRSYSLCNIGHPPPLVFRAAEKSWRMLKQPPTPCREGIGAAFCDGVIHPDEYQQLTTRLEHNDMVLSYSNVLTECRDREGQFLGMSGLLDRVEKLDVRRPAKLLPALLQQLHSEHASNEVFDMGTVMLCRGTHTKVPWRDNVLAPLRLFRRVSDLTRL